MGGTELSVICKNCGSEVSPYVTECPYCGMRLRKRAPQLERRGDALAPKQKRRRAPRLLRRAPRPDRADARPYATLVAIAASTALLLVAVALGDSVVSVGALVTPVDEDWWRYFSAAFAYDDVGYLFAVGLALFIFAGGVERRLGSGATAILLLASGSLGMLAAAGIASARDQVDVIAGGNGMALGALVAWVLIRRAESRRAIDRDYDPIAAAVAAAVLLALPIFDSTADVFAGLTGGAVGALAGMATGLRPAE